MFNKNLKYYTVAGIVLLSWIFWFIYQRTHNQALYTESKFIADFGDTKKVVWFSDNIFEWMVVRTIWKAPIENWWITHPQTLYEIKVLKNIKGDISGNITLIQEWGYDNNGNLIIEEGTSLLQDGDVYVLATKGENPYRLLNHKNGVHVIQKKGSELNSVFEKNELNTFKESYKNESLYEWDIKISSWKNNYKDLRDEDKKKLEE